MRILALGDAMVDLVCERHVPSLAAAQAFVPHPGGAVANIVSTAARLGADVALAGGAGDDSWGAWLRAQLAADGVSLERFALVEGGRTPIAFVAVDAGAQPTYHVYGEDLPVLAALADDVEDLVEDSGALLLSTNTLTREQERDVTLRARSRALELGRPVVVDPNLRLHRWPSATRAAAAARELVAGALLVRCSRGEARLLTGEDDPATAAESLLAAGARHVVVSRDADGAILRGGGLRRDVPGVPARAVDTTGAGDALTGTLLARLAASGFYPPTLAAALPEAVERASRTTERFGPRPVR